MAQTKNNNQKNGSPSRAVGATQKTVVRQAVKQQQQFC
jgi:hypothetical protein